VPSIYDFLARLLGTKPIRVRLASDAFTFRCGHSQSHVRPVVWCASAGPPKILAIGDDAPLHGAMLVELSSPQALALPLHVRKQGLTAVLARGFRGLGAEATIQRPEIIFENDTVLAAVFEGEQREALRKAALATGAIGSRFE
jgi:hypothetical protein